MADFLSRMNERLPEEEVQEYLNQIPYPGVKAVLDNAITPFKERAKQGVRPIPDCQETIQKETFKGALHKVLDKKATAAYVKAKEHLLIKNGLLYRKTWQGQANEIMFQFVVPQRHRGATLDGCH